MKASDIGFDRFPEPFHADPNTAFIKPEPDTRTPIEQYKAGEEWIYIDFSDFFPHKPYWIHRNRYYDQYLHPRHLKDLIPRKNYSISLDEV